jgi:hypothetical protein
MTQPGPWNQPPNQFGPPPNPYAPPLGQFGGPPVTQFGAGPHMGYPPYAVVRATQGSAFTDAQGTARVFVYTGAFVTPKSELELADYEDGYWLGFPGSVPPGFVVGPATPQPSLGHGGRMSCSDVLAATGAGDQVPVGRACLSVDGWSSVSTIDISATGRWDPALIDTVREAVQPR